MYLTPTFLFYSIILTDPIFKCIPKAKPLRESNPKLVQLFLFHAPLHATTPLNSRCNLAQNGVYKPTLCLKKAKICWCWVHYIKIHPRGQVQFSFLNHRQSESVKKSCQRKPDNVHLHSIVLSSLSFSR